MSPPDAPGVPGTKLPPVRSEDDLETRERLTRDKVAKKRESLRAIRKNSPPQGTPASTREEGKLLAEISEDEEELRQITRARRLARERETIQAPAPSTPTPDKPPANLAWLTYVIPPIVTGVAAILGANYIKKDDFDKALKAQAEATAALSEQLDKEREARIKLERCFEQHVAHDRAAEVVTMAGLLKVGIRIWGQAEEVKKVEWRSEAMGDPNTGKLPTWEPITADRNPIQVPVFTCVSK